MYYKVLLIEYIGHTEEKSNWAGEIEVQEYYGSIKNAKEKEKAIVILVP